MREPSSPDERLHALFERCVVQVTLAGRHAGTGFFVARGRVLTCAHVIAREHGVAVVWNGTSRPARVLQRLPEGGHGDPHPWPDLALVEVEFADHPCVRLDQREPRLGPPADQLRAVGFTDTFEKGVVRLTPVTCEPEGTLRGGDGNRLQVKGGQVLRGMSGAPLLNGRTCRVIGVVTTTRARTDDLGGWATPAAAILEGFAGLHSEQEAFHVADGSWRAAAAAVRLDGVLRPAWEELPRLPELPPSLLLQARYGVVPLHGRADELNELELWCLAPAGPALHLITGPGGAGKTRLAIELCRRMEASGWLTGFLSETAPGEALGSVQELGEPALVIIDYAETRGGDALADLAERLTVVGVADPPTRLLLLARGAGDWWQTELAARLANPDLALAGVTVRELGPVAPGVGEREAAYRTAAGAFIAAQGLPPADVVMPRLERTEFDVALHLHMAALDAVGTPADRRPGVAAQGRASALASILRRESRYWQRSATARGLHHHERVLRRAVAVATLFGAEDEGSAAAVLSRVPDLAHSPPERRRDLARWHRGLYDEQQWLAPLQPDALAEELVAEVLEECPELRRDGFGDLTPAQAERALTLLDRATVQRTRLRPALREILAGNLESLFRSAITVAVQTGDPIGGLLAEVLEVADLSPASLAELASAVPYPTTALREVAVVLATHRVRLARSSDDEAELGRSLNDLSNSLAGLGRGEPALAAIEEAVEVHRRLAQDRPDAFLPDLAMSLNNLSVSLGDLGRREPALVAIEEAVEVHRRLARDRPDAFLPHLAASLNNLSNSLAGLGRQEPAMKAIEDAVEAYRRLAQDRPNAFLPILAMSLNNLSVHLADLGRREPALEAIEEAVEVYRRLAQDRPDAFLPDLATSVNNLSNSLAGLGHREPALLAIEEAVVIRRRLAQARPDACLPGLAMSLNNLSGRLAGLGRQEPALKAIEEAVEVYRRLAQARPDAFLHYLAGSLNNLSVRLADLGRREPALEAIEEAVVIRRRLAQARPDSFVPDLATSLNNLSNHLAALGHREPALEAIEEAIEVHRRLAQDRPDAFLPDFATSLNNLSVRLAGLGRRELALNTMEETVEVYRRLAQSRPVAFLPDLAGSLDNLSVLLASLGRREAALEAIEEAVVIREELTRQNPGAFVDALARSRSVRQALLDGADADSAS